MNVFIGIGRLTRDVDVRESASGAKIARYTLAIDRGYRAEEGQPTADFIPCTCFGKTAEFAEKYLHKGMKIAIEGRIQTGSYEKDDGTRVYTTDIIVNRHEFVESRAASNGNASAPAPTQDNSFVNVPDDADDETLPFA